MEAFKTSGMEMWDFLALINSMEVMESPTDNEWFYFGLSDVVNLK